jgi:hypothetical protein
MKSQSIIYGSDPKYLGLFFKDTVFTCQHLVVTHAPWRIVHHIEPPLSDALLHVVREWFPSRRFQLNADKTELQWFGTRLNIGKIHPANTIFEIDEVITRQAPCVKYLGMRPDSELGKRNQVNCVAAACFFQLRRRVRHLRSIRGPLTLQRVVSAMVLSRFDYCNAVLAGLPASTLAPLQRVQNAAARLV